MERIVQLTKDGSQTIVIPELDITYHSRHGALQESRHVFIDAGLRYVHEKLHTGPIGVLEMGFGTGLNALLTLDFAMRFDRRINYTTLEQYPLEQALYTQLNYTEATAFAAYTGQFMQMHSAKFEETVPLHSNFFLKKLKTSLLQFDPAQIGHPIHLVYFDAFAPSAQPELWTEEVFASLASVMEPSAILVTYCSKSVVRRAMEAGGLRVEKIPGPHGKREMVRAHNHSKL